MNISINGTNYWYEVVGEGTPVVMLHGFTGSTKTWTNFVSRWKEHFQIIVIDLPGHGKTKNSSPKTMEQCCADLTIFFDILQLKEVHLVGYSMGGRTALSFAMLYPTYVTSLILESTSPGLEIEIERETRIRKDEDLAKKIEREGLERFVDFWENIPLFDSQKKLPLNVQRQIRAERLSQSESGLAESLRYMGTGSQPSWWKQLSSFEKPVLLLVGELDSKFVRINQHMDKMFPNSQLNIVEQAGHAIHVEESKKFGKIVAEFILINERHN